MATASQDPAILLRQERRGPRPEGSHCGRDLRRVGFGGSPSRVTFESTPRWKLLFPRSHITPGCYFRFPQNQAICARIPVCAVWGFSPRCIPAFNSKCEPVRRIISGCATSCVLPVIVLVLPASSKTGTTWLVAGQATAVAYSKNADFGTPPPKERSNVRFE